MATVLGNAALVDLQRREPWETFSARRRPQCASCHFSQAGILLRVKIAQQISRARRACEPNTARSESGHALSALPEGVPAHVHGKVEPESVCFWTMICTALPLDATQEGSAGKMLGRIRI